MQRPAGCSVLPETGSAPESHSIPTFLPNKAEMLYSILLTLDSISQLFLNVVRNKCVTFLKSLLTQMALLPFVLYKGEKTEALVD